MSDAGGLAQWLLRVAWSPTSHSGGRRPAGADHSAALVCPRTWHLRHTPDHASLSQRGTTSQPPSHWALTGASGLALPNAAQMQSAYRRRAGADGGTEPTQPG